MEQRINEFMLVLNKLNVLSSTNYFRDFELKSSETKWSKKEILGHLIDSAINNLQRFTEIQYAEKPFTIRTYPQDDLVKANDYQNKNILDLLHLLIELNKHIVYLINNQTEETLKYEIILPNQAIKNLQWLIEDYFNHFYHHIKQIDIQ
jgi:hypothetical protein